MRSLAVTSGRLELLAGIAVIDPRTNSWSVSPSHGSSMAPLTDQNESGPGRAEELSRGDKQENTAAVPSDRPFRLFSAAHIPPGGILHAYRTWLIGVSAFRPLHPEEAMRPGGSRRKRVVVVRAESWWPPMAIVAQARRRLVFDGLAFNRYRIFIFCRL